MEDIILNPFIVVFKQMTRINCVDVKILSRQHLLAEYRELPRVYGLVAKSKTGRKIPPNYTMGTGHVLFFYNKIGWIKARHKQLIDEMIRRGYTPTFTTAPEIQTHDQGWTPRGEDMEINLKRLRERDPSFYGGYK